MTDLSSLWFSQLKERYNQDPLVTLAVAACMVAFASTPVAFAILGKMEWFAPRRGRTMVKPTFLSIVTGMLLVMGIPAVFTAMVIKSSYYDVNRYEFDPNRTWSVLDQGRGFADLKIADLAVTEEMKRLGVERKNISDSMKKLDESLLALRVAALGKRGHSTFLLTLCHSDAIICPCQEHQEPQQRITVIMSSTVGTGGPRCFMTPKTTNRSSN